MGKQHKHADLIKAWADGADIEVYSPNTGQWASISSPTWLDACQYRIRQKSTPCHDAGYALGDIFYVKRPTYWSSVPPLVVKLIEDDDSACPMFQVLLAADGRSVWEDSTLFIGLGDVVKIENPFENA